MKQKLSVSVVCYTIAGLAALITIFPLYWTLITSFKTYKEAFAQPPDFFTAVSLDNYIAFLKQNNVLLYLKNSIIISHPIDFGAVCLLCDYPFFHSRQRGIFHVSHCLPFYSAGQHFNSHLSDVPGVKPL